MQLPPSGCPDLGAIVVTSPRIWLFLYHSRVNSGKSFIVRTISSDTFHSDVVSQHLAFRLLRSTSMYGHYFTWLSCVRASERLLKWRQSMKPRDDGPKRFLFIFSLSSSLLSVARMQVWYLIPLQSFSLDKKRRRCLIGAPSARTANYGYSTCLLSRVGKQKKNIIISKQTTRKYWN